MAIFSGRTSVMLGGVLLVLVVLGAWWYLGRHASVKPQALPSPKEIEKPAESVAGVQLGDVTTDPRKTLFENLKISKGHTTFITALQTAGLASLLQSSQTVTVFAPSNLGFGKLPTATFQGLFRPENRVILTSLLNYHIVPGRYTTKDLKDGMRLKTVEGTDIVFSKKGDQWQINGKAIVEVPDILSANGVAFSIDSVLSTQSE